MSPHCSTCRVQLRDEIERWLFPRDSVLRFHCTVVVVLKIVLFSEWMLLAATHHWSVVGCVFVPDLGRES